MTNTNGGWVRRYEKMQKRREGECEGDCGMIMTEKIGRNQTQPFLTFPSN